MKLLLVKVLVLTLATTSKDVHAQAQSKDENVAALRGSVVSIYDMTGDKHLLCSYLNKSLLFS